MIAYQVHLRCDGCCEAFHINVEFMLLAELQEHALELEADAQRVKWITDGNAHYCPKCQVQRKAS